MITPEKENEIMNPQITGVKIGIRNLRTIEILPLSMGDLTKIVGILESELKSYLGDNPDGGSELDIGNMIVKMIKDNLLKILCLAMDKKEDEVQPVLDDMSAMQGSEIVSVIYEKNFIDPFEKNLKSLFKATLGRLFQPQTQSEPYSKDTANTELKTSTEELGEKEE